MSLGLIPDLVGGLFGKKEKGGDTVNYTPPWLLELQQKLGTNVSKGLDAYTPGAAYGGNLNFAGSPTSQEQSSLQQLTKYLGQPGTGGLFDQASGQISDTLAGKYADPRTSPYIQAAQKVAQNMLNDQITQERGSRGSRGQYFTDAGVKSENLLRGRTMDNLNAIIGQFQQNERQNQLGAATTAQGLDQYKNQTVPLQQIAAGQKYGSLERLINQSNLESQYQDFLRQRTELGKNVDTATTLAINQPSITPGTVVTPKYQVNNDLGNILGIADQSLTGGGGAGASGQGLIAPQLMSLFGAGGGAGGTGGGGANSLDFAKIIALALGGI